MEDARVDNHGLEVATVAQGKTDEICNNLLKNMQQYHQKHHKSFDSSVYYQELKGILCKTRK